MNKNDIIELQITDIGTDGQGIGKSEGMAVFVKGALPGEIVKAIIIALKKNYAVGKLTEVISASPARVKPPCHVFGKCGGCTLQHLEYSEQLEFKQNRVQDCITRIAGLDIPVNFPLPSVKTYHYRNKAAFPVRLQAGKADIGLYANHSHNVIDIADCMIQHKDIAIAMSQLRVWITKYEVSIYDETTGNGLLRHIVARTNKAGEIMLVLVINGEDIPYKDELLALFRFVLPQVKSIILNHNNQNTNVIMGNLNTAIWGRDHFYEKICGIEFKVGPQTFLQVNPTQTEALYNNLFRQLALTGNENVLDLFCGVGTITLNAAKRAKHAFGIEISESAIENARFNAKLNDIENTEFFAGDADILAKQVLDKSGNIDVIIADPPRKGLSHRLIDVIAKACPQKIGYVSCDPATLARDLNIFNEMGYSTSVVQPVDMFPQTTHVECVTVISKVNE